jgi:predicted Zn-dependent protease
MTWGQSPEQGVIVNNRFMHAQLGIALQFPADWKIDNRADALFARNPGNSALLQVRLVALQKNESLGALLKRITKNSALSVEQQNYGSTARSQATVSGNQQPARVSAIKLDKNQALFIAGTSAQADFKSDDPQLLAINRSFVRLSAKQISDIKTPQLEVITATSTDSFASIAKQSAIDDDAEDILRLLNGAFPDGNITTRQNLKTITIAD